MPAGESNRHLRLKELALAWVRAQGGVVAAAEVRVPRSGYRADVAAVFTGTGGVALFECKQSRADWLKDAHAEDVVRARTAELEERRRTLEALLAVHRPELRRGEALWPEFDTWDAAAAEHRGYRRVLAELARLRRRASNGTKFARLRRWRCADWLYLVLEADLHAPAELPTGWGVLVHRGDSLVLERPAERLAVTSDRRAGWIAALARKLAGPALPGAGPGSGDDLLFAESA
jgi:hypothetical protein